MFISILISILVQMRGKDNDEPTPTRTISEAQAQSLEQEYESLQRTRQSLLQEISSQERLLIGDSREDILELNARLENEQSSIDGAIQKQRELVKKTVSVESEIAKESEAIKKLQKELQDARIAASQRSKEMDEALDAKEQTTTLPKVASTSKGNVVCAMRYGKLYFVTDPQSLLSTEIYKPHIDSRTLFGVKYIAPRKGAGWDVSTDGAAEFSAKMTLLDPSAVFVTVAVWSDSFSKFADFKALLNQLGYEYDLVPVDDDAELPLGSGSTATVQ